MPTLLIFVTYLVLALILAALVFYPVFLALQTVWDVRPDRVFYRLAMVVAALGFWPLLKTLSIDNRFALGYALERRRFVRALGAGLATGVAIMTVHALLLTLFGARIPVGGDFALLDLLYALSSGLLTGLLVAFIEESFFRGAMQGHMRRSQSKQTTFVLISLLYASLHFLRPLEPVQGSQISWSSGWEMLSGMFVQYQNFAAIADSFVALFIAGLLLGQVREKTGNIAMCIGIHAGWVMMIKFAKEITTTAPDSPAAWMIGSYDDIIGWAAAGLLGLLTLGYWRYARN